ncbi:MAG TPA: hypothetical protein DDW27_08465 [Bacteroidales bacterium]|nr:hypothetical protein [Bacteroidales bacterium]
MNVPDTLLDIGGYPTDEYLEFIRDYEPKQMPVFEFVDTILRNGWYFDDWGFVLHRKYKGKRKLELHTGGWSGNEEIIDVILSNMYLTYFEMRYVMWRVGGHYYFDLSEYKPAKKLRSKK